MRTVLIGAAILLLALTAKSVHAQQPLVVLGAPSLEPVVRQVFSWLPPQEAAYVRLVEFVPPDRLRNIGHCGESYTLVGVIWLSTDPRCLVYLYDLLLLEIGHHQPECRALSHSWRLAESEACSSQYRLSRRVNWP